MMAIGATAAFNLFFLPPIGTFTISDPQNWVALFAFLVTAVVASDLAERARREAEDAKQRRRDVERLYGLSQRLLASENVLELLNALPLFVQETFSVTSVAVMTADHPTVYRSSLDAKFDETVPCVPRCCAESPSPRTAFPTCLCGLLECAPWAPLGVAGDDELLARNFDALGSLAGLAIERARALEASEQKESRWNRSTSACAPPLLDSR